MECEDVNIPSMRYGSSDPFYGYTGKAHLLTRDSFQRRTLNYPSTPAPTSPIAFSALETDIY